MKNLLIVLLLAVPMLAENKRVSEMSGATVSAKMNAAKTACEAIAPEPCKIYIDAALPKKLGEAAPPTCSNCEWIDERFAVDVTWADVSGKPGKCQTGKAKGFETTGDLACEAEAAANPDWAAITNKPSTFAPATHTHDWSADITSKPTLFDGTWGSLSGKPSTFAPSAHTHVLADITDYSAPQGGSSFALRVTGNVSNSTTTFSNITGLTWSAVSGTSYSFQCSIYFSSAATTTGIGLAINGPAASLIRYQAIIPTTATAQSSFPATTYDATTTLGTAALTTVLEARFTGTVTPSANGTLAIRFRSEVAASAITVQAGSFCEVL